MTEHGREKCCGLSLQQRFPKMQQAVARTANLMQDAEHILAEVLAQDLVACGSASQLNLIQLQRLSVATATSAFIGMDERAEHNIAQVLIWSNVCSEK